MESVGNAYLLVLFAALALSIAAPIALARRHAWRWGMRPSRRTAIAGGAYRDAVVTEDERPRGFPPGHPFVAGIGFAWAAITMLVFAPAGLLGSLALFGVRAYAAFAAALAISIDGFVLGGALIAAGASILRCRPNASARARKVGAWSIAHHGLVLLGAMVLGAASGSGVLTLVALIPALLGLAHGHALLAVGYGPEPEAPDVP